MDFLIVMVFIFIPCGAMASSIAFNKGFNRITWFLAGFFLGPLGLIGAAGMPDKTQRRYLRMIAEGQGLKINPKVTSTSSDRQKEEPTENLGKTGEFLISKKASESEIWEKVLEVLGNELANEADRSRSNFGKLPSGGRECSIGNAEGTIFALASSNENSTNEDQWQVVVRKR